MTTHPTLNTIYAAYAAHLITFDAVVTKQQQGYPRCLPHGTPTAYTLDDVAICPACLEQFGTWIAARLAEIRRGEP